MGEFPNKETQFKKGQSGNPKGMEKGTRHAKTIIQKYLYLRRQQVNPLTGEDEELSSDEKMWLEQIAKAEEGDGLAIDRIYNRTEGKPLVTTAEVDADESEILDGLHKKREQRNTD